MPETSTPTLTPDGTTKFPAFQNNNPGNVEVDALKAYILSQAGLANGLATLDENGKLDSSQIPVNLDDVLVYPSYASLPATGETGKLYITSDVNGTYYWNGTSYQILNQSFVRYRGSLSSLPSDPQPGDWFIAASSFSSYTSGHIYLYNGSSWDDVTAVFGQFVLKTDIVQSLGQQTDKVPSNKAVDDAINTLNTRVTNIEETLMGENEVTVQYPSDSTYSSLMPNKVPSRALKFAEVPRFRGKSRAWNQLCGIPSSSASYSGNGITFTDNRDGSYTLQTDANGATADATIPITPMNITQGKAILLGGAPSNSSITTHRMLFSSVGINTYMSNGDDIYIINGDTTMLILQVFAGDVVATPITFKPFIRDLNIIFQEYTTAQIVTLGMAGVLSVIPPLGQYNAYDAGSLVDTVVSGVKAVGVNIWDEEWENGTINLSTGADVPSSSYVRSKGYIEVTPLSMLYFCMAVGQRADGMYVCYYDDNKNFIRPVLANSANALVYQMPFNCRYIRFYMAGGYGSTYNHDIQICLNSYADKTTYHPYKTDTLSLSTPVTLRSAGSVADELDVESGVVTRKIGSVDLGTLDWSYYSTGGITHFYSDTLTDIKKGSDNNYVMNAITPLYQCVSITVMNTETIPKTIAISSDGYLCIDDDAYTDAPTFKTAMSGVYLYYELATPTTESIDPVPYNFLEVEGGGTVETIQTQTPVIDNCLDVTYDIIPQ